jgi:hypothetical protein
VHILDLQCLNVVFLKEVSRSLETICSANDHIEDSQDSYFVKAANQKGELLVFNGRSPERTFFFLSFH